MNQVVVNMMKCTDKSIIASNRIAKYIAMTLGCPLIDDKKAVFSKQFDRVYVVNGPMLYCGFRDELKEIVANAKEVVWVQNEYGIDTPGFVKVRDPIIMSNCDNFKKSDRYFYVNWNQLTFVFDLKAQKVTHGGLCYYGAFRKDRRPYFEKYLCSDLYEVHISSSANGSKKFKELTKGAKYFHAGGNILNALGAFESTLYIEDNFTHKVYNSPANRFYEALSAFTLLLFDTSCRGTFERAGIDIEQWVVDGPEEYAQKLSNSEHLRCEQVEKLRSVDWYSLLNKQFEAARLAAF